MREAVVCDDVCTCVVDTGAWVRDPQPLFRTLVEGLRGGTLQLVRHSG